VTCGSWGDDGVTIHWNGLAWSVVANPTGGSNAFTSVFGWGPNNVLAGGQGFILQWNGTAWSVPWGNPTSSIFDYAQSIWGASPGNVWAVGQDSCGSDAGGSGVQFILHYQ
jgi:hypothetical protein